MKSKFLAAALAAGLVLGSSVTLTGCIMQSDIVSRNIQMEADNFNIIRRLIVVNARTDRIIFIMTGKISYTVDDSKHRLEVLVEDENGNYKKHFINLNEWTLYTIEDLNGSDVSNYRYSVKFFPEEIAPYNIQIGDD